MKDFTRPKGRLANLPFYARVVYSVFLLFTLAGLAITLWLTEDMVRLNLSKMDSYYAGTPDDPPVASSTASSQVAGPALDLPEDANDVIPKPEPMPLRKLLEVTHFHLFSMPLYLMILSHLYMLSRARDQSKALWIVVGTLSVAVHIVAPWIARSGTTLSHYLYGISGTALVASFLVMAIVPLWEMWIPQRGLGAANQPQR